MNDADRRLLAVAAAQRQVFTRAQARGGRGPIVVEVGGRRGYLSLDERRRQERRRNELQLLGRTVYFFTTEDVRDDTPYVLATLVQALRAA